MGWINSLAHFSHRVVTWYHITIYAKGELDIQMAQMQTPEVILKVQNTAEMFWYHFVLPDNDSDAQTCGLADTDYWSDTST